MSSLPEPIHHAAASFDTLPGVGPRAALRYASWLVTQPKDAIVRFAQTLIQLAEHVRTCSVCYQWSDAVVCPICRDTTRDTTVLCVVAISQDVLAIEETRAFKGRYHVLGGTIDPLEGRTPERLTIRALQERLQDPSTPIKEVILALDPDVSGDTTALYIKKQLENLPVRVTRPARGLPSGSSLEYTDALTLADALKNRT